MIFLKIRSLLLRLILCLLSFNFCTPVFGQIDSFDWNHFFAPCINGGEYEVDGEVFFIKQKRRNDCWFACYLMMKSWKERKRVDYRDEMSKMNDYWRKIWKRNNGGINDKNQDRFVEDFSLGFYPPANYVFEAYVEFINKHGPLMIITGSYERKISHARILFKIECGPDPNRTYFYLFDPEKNRVLKWTSMEFFDIFENEARGIVDNNHINLFDWRYQIIYIK